MADDEKSEDARRCALADAGGQSSSFVLAAEGRTNMIGMRSPHEHDASATIKLCDVTPHNWKETKQLEEAIFARSHDERLYTIKADGEAFAKVAHVNDRAVGLVLCSLRTTNDRKQLHIHAIGVLAPYRRFGVAGMLMNSALGFCDGDRAIKCVDLHVRVDNASAIRFYERFGFTKISLSKDHYPNETPSDAFLMEKSINRFED
ncbi:N-alpha-acetyltransferase 50 [Aphelenchoides fujianensis]|nr:N-alpha-acetyltransferase 50 [Aphelenchoides fujianensis]KAI6239519.1 N-alpha-acetyltransferase 50 [Aphelenchoides fujianensis]